MPKSSFFSFQDIIMSVTGILIVIALMLALQVDKITVKSSSGGLSTDTDQLSARSGDLENLEETLAGLKEQLETLQNATRKTESEAELVNQIARLEERVLNLSSQNPTVKNTANNSAEFAEVKAKTAEILRLREEIKKHEEAIAQMAEQVASSGDVMQQLEQKVKELEAQVVTARLKSRNLRLIRELSDTTKEPIIVDVRSENIRLMRFDQAQVTEVGSNDEFRVAITRFRKQDQYFVFYFRPDGTSRFNTLRDIVKNAGFEVGYDAIEEGADLALGKEEGP
jgi:myosin heavy subunit